MALMVLERFLMKLFCPRKLARRDIIEVYKAVSGAYGRCQQGHWISMATGIPEHDLDYLLMLMEQDKYIDRDPGPFDQPYTSDRLASWWGPGRNWLELKALYRGEL